jgi:hypothetical protein
MYERLAYDSDNRSSVWPTFGSHDQSHNNTDNKVSLETSLASAAHQKSE